MNDPRTVGGFLLKLHCFQHTQWKYKNTIPIIDNKIISTNSIAN